MKTLQTIKNGLIHILGGYTQSEDDCLMQEPEHGIKKETVYPVTVTEHYTIAKEFWDTFTEKHLMQERIRKELLTFMAPRLNNLVRCSGPILVNPTTYGFYISLSVLPPSDYSDGECLSK